MLSGTGINDARREQEGSDADEYVGDISEDKEKIVVEWDLKELMKLLDEREFHKIL